MTLRIFAFVELARSVTWKVSFHEDFEAEFDALDEAVQDELLAHAKLLEHFGPQLGRPRVDTLNGASCEYEGTEIRRR